MSPSNHWHAPLFCGFLVLGGGCASAPPAQQVPPAPPPAAAEPVPAEPAPSDPVPTNTEAEAAASPPESAVETPANSSPAADAVASACQDLCQRAAQECSSRSARKCRANCERYQSIADRCSNEVLAALKCQASVPNLVCSNVVGPCAADFQTLTSCENGSAGATVAVAERPALPPEWTELKDDEAGFSVMLPKQVAPTGQGKQRTWRAPDASGVSYVVAVRPPFNGEVNDKNLVVRVLQIVGYDCQKDLKIHGRFEVSGKTAVRFDTVCRGGDAWHGMLRISDAHVIMTAEIVPTGMTGQGDAFYFSFAYL